MATPHIAGIVAQLFEKDPAATPADVERALEVGAHKFTDGAAYETDPRGNGTTSFDKGHGLVDVMALRSAWSSAQEARRGPAPLAGAGPSSSWAVTVDARRTPVARIAPPRAALAVSGVGGTARDDDRACDAALHGDAVLADRPARHRARTRAGSQRSPARRCVDAAMTVPSGCGGMRRALAARPSLAGAHADGLGALQALALATATDGATMTSTFWNSLIEE